MRKLHFSIKDLFSVIVFLFFTLFLSNSYGQDENLNEEYKEQIGQFQQLLREGKILESVTILDGLMDKYPDVPEAFYAKSLLYAQAGDITVALPLAETAVRLKPLDFVYSGHLINLYQSQNNVDGALVVLDRLLLNFPDASVFHRQKIITLHNANRNDGAFLAYDKAVVQSGRTDTLDVVKAEILTNLSRFDEAIGLLSTWSEQKSETKEVYSFLSYAYMGKGNAKLATAVLQSGLQNAKDDVLYLDLANVYVAEQKFKIAYEALKSAFLSKKVEYTDKHQSMVSVINEDFKFTFEQKIDLANILIMEYPRIADTYVFKSDLLWQNARLEEARSLLLKSIGVNARQEQVWRRLLNLELSLNRLDDLLTHGKESLEYYPNHPLLHYFMGVAYFIQNDKEHALRYLESALDLSQQENDYIKSMIYGSLGDLYHKLEMVSVSDAAYEEAIRLDSTNTVALNNLAYYLSIRKESLTKAAEYALKANILNPESGTFQDTYAWVLFQQGNYAEAKIWIEKAVKGGNPSALLLEHYGDILIMLGREREALKQWGKALNHPSKDQSVDLVRLKQKISEKKYIE